MQVTHQRDLFNDIHTVHMLYTNIPPLSVSLAPVTPQRTWPAWSQRTRCRSWGRSILGGPRYKTWGRMSGGGGWGRTIKLAGVSFYTLYLRSAHLTHAHNMWQWTRYYCRAACVHEHNWNKEEVTCTHAHYKILYSRTNNSTNNKIQQSSTWHPSYTHLWWSVPWSAMYTVLDGTAMKIWPLQLLPTSVYL